MRIWYAQTALSWGLEHRALVVWVSFGSLAVALLLIPLGIVGFEYYPPVDRGEIYLTITYPTGTPLTSVTAAVRQAEQIVRNVPDLQSETSMAGAYVGQLTGYINNGAIGQMHIFLKTGGTLDPVLVAAAREPDQNALPDAHVTGVPATDLSGGNAQPIGYVVDSPTADPTGRD